MTNNQHKQLDSHDLNIRQRRFVKIYVQCFNASKAYREAGYENTDSVRISACKLLTKPNIQKAIEQKMAEIAVNVKVTPEDVIRMLRNEALGLTKVEGSTMSQSARVTAISLLGKVHGMFIDNQNVNVTDLDARMRRANARIEAKRAAAAD